MSDVTNVGFGNRDETKSHTRVTRTVYTSTSTSTPAPVPSGDAQRTRVRGQGSSISDDVEGAVFAYIQAIRALGRTRISTADIAIALDLAPKTVERAVVNLKGKGVKLIG